jgi:hypothetical protein
VGELPPILIEVSPGELIDRLTILELRARRLTDPLKAIMARRELAALSRVRAAIVSASDDLSELAERLQAVNEALWAMEDEIRGTIAAERVAKLARKICRANDQRGRLKQRINAVFGIISTDEKQYPHFARLGRPKGENVQP